MSDNLKQTEILQSRERERERQADAQMIYKCIKHHDEHKAERQHSRDADTALKILAAMYRDDKERCWVLRDYELELVGCNARELVTRLVAGKEAL